jgi:hypothetical protein
VVKYEPSPEKVTAVTDVFTSNTCGTAPVAASQIRTVLSNDADASCKPSLENATDITKLEWPCSTCIKPVQEVSLQKLADEIIID